MRKQTTLDVGDTRKPVAVKNDRRVTTGDLAALAMCAHRYDPEDVRGWHTHDYDDVRRQWICSNVESVIARLSPHCEDTRGERPPLHPADDLWVGERDTGPEQATLVTDGGTDPNVRDYHDCPECGEHALWEGPDAGYWTCDECGRRFTGSRRSKRRLHTAIDYR